MTPFVRPLGMMWAPPRPAVFHLGQAAMMPVRIVVTDINGRPISASISINGGASGTGQTDSGGSFPAKVPSGRPFRVMVQKDDNVVVKEFPAPGPEMETAYVQIPVCLAQPIMTTPEIVALVGAAVVTASGFYWNVDALKITGETFFAAVVFTSLHRLSCL